MKRENYRASERKERSERVKKEKETNDIDRKVDERFVHVCRLVLINLHSFDNLSFYEKSVALSSSGNVHSRPGHCRS